MKNLRSGVDKVVGKVLINLLCHAKSAACVISIIINAPAVAYTNSGAHQPLDGTHLA